MLKCALFLSLLKSCGPPNDIISLFGRRLKKFADPWDGRCLNTSLESVDTAVLGRLFWEFTTFVALTWKMYYEQFEERKLLLEIVCKPGD